MTINVPNEFVAVLLSAACAVGGWLALRIERLHTRLTRIETKLELFDLTPRRVTRVAGIAAIGILTVILPLLDGCGIGLRAKGGSMSHASTVTRQPENPKDGAQQKTERTIEVPLPAGSQLAYGSNWAFRLAADSVFRDVDKTESKIGGSQIDTVGTVVAKLKSARWMVILGCLAFLAGLGASFWPPARAVMGGITPGLVTAGGGLVIAVLPYLVIGNEKFLTAAGLVTALGIGGGIFLYRHGGHGREISLLHRSVTPHDPKS